MFSDTDGGTSGATTNLRSSDRGQENIDDRGHLLDSTSPNIVSCTTILYCVCNCCFSPINEQRRVFAWKIIRDKYDENLRAFMYELSMIVSMIGLIFIINKYLQNHFCTNIGVIGETNTSFVSCFKLLPDG